MKKIYLIYAKIPSLLFDNKMCNFVKDSTLYNLKNGYYTGLYAWTTNKIILDAFMEFRKGARKIYKLKIRKFTKEEYYTFRDIHQYEELSYYRIPTRNCYDEEFNSISYIPKKNDSKMDKESFFHKNKDVNQIVCTKEETIELFEYGDQHLHDYMFQTITADYYAFKDEYKIALDVIGYCDEFNRIHDGFVDTDEEDHFYSDRHEMTNYCQSYQLSFYGNKAIDIYDNKVALFIMIYYEMICGYHEDEEIKLLIYN